MAVMAETHRRGWAIVEGHSLLFDGQVSEALCLGFLVKLNYLKK